MTWQKVSHTTILYMLLEPCLNGSPLFLWILTRCQRSWYQHYHLLPLLLPHHQPPAPEPLLTCFELFLHTTQSVSQKKKLFKFVHICCYCCDCCCCLFVVVILLMQQLFILHYYLCVFESVTSAMKMQIQYAQWIKLSYWSTTLLKLRPDWLRTHTDLFLLLNFPF